MGLLASALAAPAVAPGVLKLLPNAGSVAVAAPSVAAMSPQMRLSYTALSNLLTFANVLKNTAETSAKQRSNPMWAQEDLGHRYETYSEEIAAGSYTSIAKEMDPRIREFYSDTIEAYRCHCKALQVFYSEKTGNLNRKTMCVLSSNQDNCRKTCNQLIFLNKAPLSKKL